MKEILLYLGLFILQVIASPVYGNNTSIDFSEITYDQALEYAVEENKLVFINFNAQEVVPCQIMASTTYQNKDVINILNSFYINVVADVDKEIGSKWIDRFNIECLPTIMILDSGGKLLGINQGNLSSVAFIRWLGLIGVPNGVNAYAISKNQKKTNPLNLLEIKKNFTRVEDPTFITVDNSESLEIKILSTPPSSSESYKAKTISTSKTKNALNSFSFTPTKTEKALIETEKPLLERVPLPKEPHFVKNSEAYAMSYSIQIGAFGKYLNAKKYVEKSSCDFESPYYILEETRGDGKTLFKVVTGAFNSKKEAKLAESRLEKLGYNGFIRNI